MDTISSRTDCKLGTADHKSDGTRVYEADMRSLDEQAQNQSKQTGITRDKPRGPHDHSIFWQDTLLRTVETPLLVRRSLTMGEALKALISPRYRRHMMVAVECALTSTDKIVDDVTT